MLTYQVPKSPSNQAKGSLKLPRPSKLNQTLPLPLLTQNQTAVTLQRAANQPPPIEQAPAIVNEVLRSSGQPLDESTRTFMEPRFGYNFGQVRIHTDAKAAESAQAVNARAYTVGQHVVMRVTLNSNN